MLDKIKIKNRIFDLKSDIYLMGILNLTPDSFSDGGKFNNIESALNQVEKMILSGADIIDIGGESTRPGYKMISDQEEIERIINIIIAIKSRFDVIISVDTCKSKVAEAVLNVGVDFINDIWGLKYDKNMAGLIKKYNVPVCIMHNRKEIDFNIDHKSFLERTQKEILESINIAKKNEIQDDKIIIDPGIGFGKTYEQNLLCIKNLELFKKFGYPVLLGTSRKSVIGLTLDLPVDQREEGTIATSIIAKLKGCNFLRVHDVEKNYRALRMTKAIINL